MNAIPLEQEVEYPISDGQPMAESPLHLKVMLDLVEGLTAEERLRLLEEELSRLRKMERG